MNANNTRNLQEKSAPYRIKGNKKKKLKMADGKCYFGVDMKT